MSSKYFIKEDGDPLLSDVGFLADLGHPKSVNVVPIPINKDATPWEAGAFTGYWQLETITGPVVIRKGEVEPGRTEKPPEIDKEYIEAEIKIKIEQIKSGER